MGNMANRMSAKAGGLADVSASLVSALFELGADVHVALPHYRRMFNIDVGRLISRELTQYKRKLPRDRIHLAEDRIFYYREEVYSSYGSENPRIAMAFQREVINNIVPRVHPDLIHCNDWMTGLVPAMARRQGTPCLFTVHNIHTQKVRLSQVEDSGIDAAEFWHDLFFAYPPRNYEETRDDNDVDLLASGIFASHYINTVSQTFLDEICRGCHDFIPPVIRSEIANKRATGCAAGILNAPDSTFMPETDEDLPVMFGPDDHIAGKAECKHKLQERLGLETNPDAPIFFWPSRLDPVQKGCQLLAEILYGIVSDYWERGLQVVFVANGSYQPVFHNIVRHHDFSDRVAVCDFRDSLSHHAYAAADFMLMPSLFEPCGLPQMISPIYGTLPIVHDTGGLHDTVVRLNAAEHTGNGFVFETHDSAGLRWAVDEAMRFHALPAQRRAEEIERIMLESRKTFSHEVTAERYFDIYEEMLDRPLVNAF